jgi:hypothetical protein
MATRCRPSRKASTSKCRAARDRTNPRSVARTEISTEIIAARAYPVVGRNFNGAGRIGVFSSTAVSMRDPVALSATKSTGEPGDQVLANHRLSECDVLVAEASGSSYGVGFEVGYVLGRARGTGQRVVLVHDASRRRSISRLITGNCDAACTTFAYTTLEELGAFVDRHFSATDGSSETARTITG